MLVEGSNFALCILCKCLRVDHLFATLSIVHNDSIEPTLFTVFKLLCLVLAGQVLSVGLLVPHLKKKGTAVVLERGQVSIDVDVGLDKPEEDLPGFLHALRVKKYGPDKRLKHVTEDLQVMLVESVQVELFIRLIIISSTCLAGPLAPSLLLYKQSC